MDDTSTKDQPVGDLVKQLSKQTSDLVRKEMALAQAELQEKGKRAGIGAGLFGGAGLIALYGVGALIAAAILALATAVEPWLAAAILGVVLLAAAGGAALVGKQQVQEAGPPTPEQAMRSTKRDVDTIKERAAR